MVVTVRIEEGERTRVETGSLLRYGDLYISVASAQAARDLAGGLLAKAADLEDTDKLARIVLIPGQTDVTCKGMDGTLHAGRFLRASETAQGYLRVVHTDGSVREWPFECVEVAS